MEDSKNSKDLNPDQLEVIKKEIYSIRASFDELIRDSIAAGMTPDEFYGIIKWKNEALKRLADKYRFVKDIETLQRTNL